MLYQPELHILKNGIPVILDNFDAGVSYVSIGFSTGGYDESDEQSGITHFLEHMLCKETKNFPSLPESKEYIQNISARTNAVTSPEHIEFVGHVISENLPLLLDFLCDRLENAIFDEQRIEREKGVIKAEISLKSNNLFQTFFLFIARKLFDVPDRKDPISGTETTVDSFTREQVIDFMHQRLSAKNCLVAISGKIQDSEKILELLDKKLAFLPQHNVETKRDYKVHFGNYNLPRENSATTDICIVFDNIVHISKNTEKQKIAIAFFMQYLSENLLNELRHNSGMLYSISSFLMIVGNTLIPAIKTSVPTNNLDKIMENIYRTIDKSYSDIPQEIIKKYLNNNRLAMANLLDSPSQRLNKLVRYYSSLKKLFNPAEELAIQEQMTVQDLIKYNPKCKYYVLSYGQQPTAFPD